MADLGGSTNGFVKRTMIAVAVIAAAILGLVLAYYTIDILMLIFAAALLAIFLRGLADVIRPYVKLGDGWRVLLVTSVLIAVIAGATALLAPSVAEQGKSLRQKIPESAQKVGEFLGNYTWGQALLSRLPTVDDVMAKVDAGDLASRVGGYFSSTIGAVGDFFIVILLGIYFASEPRFYARGAIRLFPIDRRERAGEVIGSIYQTLRWWLIGKAGSMIFIGLLTWIGLSILGVPLALTLGLIAGLLSFIPNFGPIISAVPAILLAFIDSPISAVYVIGLYVGVQVIESNIVTPLIERETVELAPALTVVFQLVLGALTGGLGLVLATPLLAVIVVVVKMVYIQDVLGEGKELNAESAEDAGQLPFEAES